MKKRHTIILSIWAAYIIVPMIIWGACFMNPTDWATITIFFTWHTISTLTITAFVIWIMVKDYDGYKNMEQKITDLNARITERDTQIEQLKHEKDLLRVQKDAETALKNHEIEQLKNTQP